MESKKKRSAVLKILFFIFVSVVLYLTNFYALANDLIENGPRLSRKYHYIEHRIPRIINIPEDYSTIQEGINAAMDGDTVLVSAGTYFESINFLGKAIKVKSEGGAGETIIDARGAFPSAVIFESGESSRSVLDGFTLRGAELHGISCISSSPIITHNIISGNAQRGILCENSSARIINNTINGNGLEGISCFSNSSVIIKDNIIVNNGNFGIYSQDSSPEISYNDVWNNDENYGGNALPGEGNISSDPLFEAIKVSIPEDYPAIQEGIDACGIFRLGNGSPCINASSDGKNMGAYPEQETYGSPGAFEVYVSSGTYLENLMLTPSIQLLGENRDTTIISSKEAEKEAVLVYTGNANAAIRGFAVKGGSFGIKAYGASLSIGNNTIKGNNTGISGAESSLIIRDNIITDNTFSGIYGVLSTFEITNNSISANGAEGIKFFVVSDPSFITGNVIVKNGTNGLDIFASSPALNNNIVSNNVKSGIGCSYSAPIMTNNTIVSNGGDGVGFSFSSPAVTNNIVTNNLGYGIYGGFGSSPAISYNDVWNNIFGDYGGNAYQGEGDISSDPLLAAPVNDDYHIQGDSSCIDAGSNDAPGLPLTDFEQDPRIIDGNENGEAVVDMGADEY